MGLIALELYAIARIFIVYGLAWGFGVTGTLLLSFLVVFFLLYTMRSAITSVQNKNLIMAILFSGMLYQQRDTILPALGTFVILFFLIIIVGSSI
jgi:hypothetical protein